MSVCFYADIVVYFLAGFLLVLVWKQPQPQKPDDKPPSWTARVKVYVMALLMGLLLAGLRFGLQRYFNRSTVCKIAATLEPEAVAVPLAAVVDCSNVVQE